MIYFDNASTTQIDSSVVSKMCSVLSDVYGNSSGKYHEQAQKANFIVKEARNIVSSFLNVESDEIIFNSGASEGNNHILKGISLLNPDSHIITSKVEHNSTLQACKDLAELGYQITYLNTNEFGIIDLNQLKESISTTTKLVSIIWANNEIGSLNNIEEISEICKEHNVFLHVDATQAIGKIKIDLKKLKVDFLTFSGHKIYGPKGVGVLYMRKDSYGLFPEVKPLISGSQEDDQRGGTLSTHNIAGIGKAVEVLNESLDEYIHHLKELEQHFIKRLKDFNVIFNGYIPTQKVLGIINIQLPGVNNEIFLKENSETFALSTGSACSLSKPSNVLDKIGLNKFQIRNSLRISFGKNNTIEEIDKFINLLQATYNNL
ncbi:MAG: cysteine desulfurase family protein [Fusobacteriaceae bacterium]